MPHVIVFYHSRSLSVDWEECGVTLIEIDQAVVEKTASDLPAITTVPFFLVVQCLARDLFQKVGTLKRKRSKTQRAQKNPKPKISNNQSHIKHTETYSHL